MTLGEVLAVINGMTFMATGRRWNRKQRRDYVLRQFKPSRPHRKVTHKGRVTV